MLEISSKVDRSTSYSNKLGSSNHRTWYFAYSSHKHMIYHCNNQRFVGLPLLSNNLHGLHTNLKRNLVLLERDREGKKEKENSN